MGSDYARPTSVTATASVSGAMGRSRVLALLLALRPYQWPKNMVVFAAFAFSAGDTWTLGAAASWWPLLWRTTLVFGTWCLAASAVYLFNDIQDREVDRLHPRKQFRPIAAGEVSVPLAGLMAAALVAIALGGAFLLAPGAAAVLAGYVGVMGAYSLGLKRVAILDVIILCGGAVARAVSGGLAIDVEISPWLYVCSSFGAFFFASSKRWAEYRQLGADAVQHRPALAQYGGEILGQLVVISAATALLSYALYTIESVHVPKNGAMALTIPFVAFALFRYLLLLNGPRKADAPDRILFTDPQILVAVAGFGIAAITVLLVGG